MKRNLKEYLFIARRGVIIALILVIGRVVFGAFGLSLCQSRAIESWVPGAGVWYTPMLIILGLATLVVGGFEYWRFKREPEENLAGFGAGWIQLTLILTALWLALVCP